MFTKNQLNFLIRVQAADDWHCSCFVEVVKDYHSNPVHNVVTIPQTEYEGLMVILAKASLEDIFNLQMALNCLNLLSYQMFEPSK